MGARRHRNKKEETHAVAAPTKPGQSTNSIPPGAAGASRDHALDSIFDPAHVRLSSVMQRQSELATLAWHFALASIFIPVAGIVLGLLAVLFAREAQDMFDLVGGSDFDRRRAQKAMVIGGTMTGVWLVGTVLLIVFLAPRGF